MHKLGLVHNDSYPSHIMVDEYNPVIINLDTCNRERDELSLKAGTYKWRLDSETYAR